MRLAPQQGRRGGRAVSLELSHRRVLAEAVRVARDLPGGADGDGVEVEAGTTAHGPAFASAWIRVGGSGIPFWATGSGSLLIWGHLGLRSGHDGRWGDCLADGRKVDQERVFDVVRFVGKC